jgi:hypothetical protein
MAVKTVTLIDGRTVPSDSAEWRDETLARWRHVQAVMAMRGKANQPARQQYIEQVDFLEGAEAGRRLREQVKAAWTQGENA